MNTTNRPIRKNKRFALAAIVFGAMTSSSVSAFATGMHISGRTTQPIGHYDFCNNAPRECQAVEDVAPHTLTRKDWQKMVDLNNHINSTIMPLTDQQIWGKQEVWSYPETVGDCEDFVLLKRHHLMRAGFSPANLLITVVRQPNGDGHAVLTVRTDRGDFILDNLVSSISDWRDTPYQYLKRQSSRHAGRWVAIEDRRPNVALN